MNGWFVEINIFKCLFRESQKSSFTVESDGNGKQAAQRI